MGGGAAPKKKKDAEEKRQGEADATGDEPAGGDDEDVALDASVATIFKRWPSVAAAACAVPRCAAGAATTRDGRTARGAPAARKLPSTV